MNLFLNAFSYPEYVVPFLDGSEEAQYSTVQYSRVTVSSQRTPLALPPTPLGCDRYSKHPQVGAILFFAEVEDQKSIFTTGNWKSTQVKHCTSASELAGGPSFKTSTVRKWFGLNPSAISESEFKFTISMCPYRLAKSRGGTFCSIHMALFWVFAVFRCVPPAPLVTNDS